MKINEVTGEDTFYSALTDDLSDRNYMIHLLGQIIYERRHLNVYEIIEFSRDIIKLLQSKGFKVQDSTRTSTLLSNEAGNVITITQNNYAHGYLDIRFYNKLGTERKYEYELSYIHPSGAKTVKLYSMSGAKK